MKIESQVVNLELSKKLKELGVKQESLFYWSKLSIQTEYRLELRQNIFNQEWIFADFSDYISSFTSSELFEIIFQKNNENLEETGYLEIIIEMVYRSGGDFYRLKNNLYEGLIDELNLCNALAKMIIHLIENKLLEI
jgi:hypothetical protein